MEGCCSFLVACCKLTPGGRLLIPGGLLLIAGDCCYFRVVTVIFWCTAVTLLPDGNIFLFQLLWKGTTDLCHLKMSLVPALHISSLIVHDQATHKFHCTLSLNAQATVAQEILPKFRSGFISHSSRKIVWEISHQMEMRNILRQKIPPESPPPPRCTPSCGSHKSPVSEP